jgi:hypothetical protein
MEIEYLFKEKLYKQEVSKSKNFGCALVSRGPVFLLNKLMNKEEIIKITQQDNILISQSLLDFYTQVYSLSFDWKIFEGMNPSIQIDPSIQFKNSPWLKENYLDDGYSWEALSILLSGHLNISELKNIIDEDDLKATGMYQAAERVGLKAGELRPIDFNEYAVACMKIIDGELIDNIYLYTGFGDYPTALHDMGVNFEQYLQLAYKAKCFNYWNLIYCLREKVHNYELMKRYFPVIFPHLEPDLEDFGIKY